MARRRDILTLGAIAPALLSGAKTPVLPDVTRLAKDAKLTREPFGDLLIYFDGPTDQVKAMTAGSLRLKPGMSPHPEHEHPEEEFILVTEGSGEIVIGGKTTQVGPGSMMYSAANKMHGIRSTGKTPLMFYFFKWKA